MTVTAAHDRIWPLLLLFGRKVYCCAIFDKGELSYFHIYRAVLSPEGAAQLNVAGISSTTVSFPKSVTFTLTKLKRSAKMN